MLIKDLKNVKDEEITLQDVKRAEEIIERANKLLGRKTECHHHWGGWSYYPVTTTPGNVWGGLNGTLYCGTTSVVEAVNRLA